MKRFIAFTAFGFWTLTACAPSPSNREDGAPSVRTGPRVPDVDLGLQDQAINAKLIWNEDATPAALFRLTENWLALNGTANEETRRRWMRTLWKGLPRDRFSIAASAYSDLLAQQTRDEADAFLKETLPQILAAPAVLRQALLSQAPPLGPRESPSLDEDVRRAIDFVNRFGVGLSTLRLHHMVESAVRDELARRLPPLEKAARQAIASLQSSGRLQSVIDVTLSFVQAQGFHLATETRRRLESARRLGAGIDAFRDAEGALSILIDIWNFLDPDDRRSVFRSASADLYDYLKDQDAEGLRCLKDPSCPSFSKWLAKKVVIEPQLEQYGLERLRTQMNTQGATAARREVRIAVADELRTLPTLIADLIEETLTARVAPFLRMQKDYAGEMRERFDAWATKTLEKDGPSIISLKPMRAKVSLSSEGQMKIQWVAVSTTTLENIGSASAFAPLFWERNDLTDADRRSALLSQMASLAQDYRDNAAERAARADAMPALSQAEIVRGLSRLSRAFRDDVTAIDGLLSSFKASMLFPDLSVPELDRSLFPKDAFLALSLANVGEHLQTITEKRSQVFLVDLDNRLTWANDYRFDAAPATTTVMAGVVDRSGDARAPIAKAEDVARYLIGLCEFLDATKNIEATQSSFLLRPDDAGRVPRDRVLQARDQIRLLALGLANSLSHQFRGAGDLVMNRLDIASQKPVDSIVTVLDQALAIRALVAVSRSLGIELYRWEAVDLVSSMNRSLYRADLGFYGRPEDRTVTAPVLLETLRALDAVAPDLSPESQDQINKLTAPWKASIARWNLVAGA